MVGTIDIELQAHNPQFPLHPINAIAGSPSSIRLRNVPKTIGTWKITKVYFTAAYPDATTKSVECKLVGGVWIGTFDGCPIPGTTKNGFIVYADGIDENENQVNGYILGMGDIFIISSDGRIIPQDLLKVVNIVSEKSPNPHIGDAIWVDDEFEIFDGVEWKSISGIKSYNDLVDKPSINLHELQGGDQQAEDLGLQSKLPESLISTEPNAYAITTDYALRAISDSNGNDIVSTYARKDEIPTKTSQLEKDDVYDKQEVDDKIMRFVAHYLTTKTNGRFVPFATHAELAYAKQHHTEETPMFFYAGEGFTPTKNDYCVILDDETRDHKTTRYSYVGEWPDGQWQYQYTINDTQFSQAQWDAINSGMTLEKLQAIDTDLAEIDGKVENLEIEIDKKADIVEDTVVGRIDEEQHDDNITARIIRVPIEFVRKQFNGVKVTFHEIAEESDFVYLGIGYSIGDGGSSGLLYTDKLVGVSIDRYNQNDLGEHIYHFSDNVVSLIPSEAKFLTFFSLRDSDIEEPIYIDAPIETGYATDEEIQQKKYQIQQSAGFFFVDHAPLMEFILTNDPVARKSYVDNQLISQTSMVLSGEYEDGTTFSFDVVIK